jgi:hypothetical protein|tara:strand:- start:4462 stop:4710 length:249 start_codon:yes stop_codon:yes gene_type:complete
MQHYLIKEGHELRGHRNELLGVAGDVIALATDSPDKTKRHEAEALLKGKQSSVTLVEGLKESKPKKKSKKATYQTKDSTPEA